MGSNLVFGRAFHLILMHLFLLYSMLWGKFSKNLVFLSKSCFSRISIDPIYFSININFALKFMWASAWFDWSNLFFDQSKIIFQVFLKQFYDCSSFSKSFSTFLLSPTWQGFPTIFCHFLPQFLQGFPPSRPVRPFYPSFLLYFHVFMHIFMHLGDIFGIFWFLGFLMIQGLFSEIDHWVLMGYCYIHDWCWLIWSIWDFMKNWKF